MGTLIFIKDLLVCTGRHFERIDGDIRAAAFSYYGFFSLFPLLLLLIAGGSYMLGSEQKSAEIVLKFVEQEIPLNGEDRAMITSAVAEIALARGNVTIVAFAVLLWGSLRFFQAPINGINQAWEGRPYNWWTMPLKNLSMVGILIVIVLVGVLLPIFVDSFSRFAEATPWLRVPVMLEYTRALISPALQFTGILLFYKFAPRRHTRFAEVWPSALLVTIALQCLQWGLVFYVYRFANFSRMYGPFAVVIIILMWIYLTGILLLMGGCLSRAIRDTKTKIPLED